MNNLIIFLAIIGGLAMGALLIWFIVVMVQGIYYYFYGAPKKAEADFRSDMRRDSEYIISELRTLYKVYEQYIEMLGKQMSDIEKQIAELKEKETKDND